MAIGRAVTRERTVRPHPAPAVNVRAFLSALQRPIAFTGRLLLGSGSNGPRGYKREGFPEHELYQLMSGHRDRMDGYPGGRTRRNG